MKSAEELHDLDNNKHYLNSKLGTFGRKQVLLNLAVGTEVDVKHGDDDPQGSILIAIIKNSFFQLLNMILTTGRHISDCQPPSNAQPLNREGA